MTTEQGWPCQGTGSALDSPTISHITSTISSGIAIESFLIPPFFWDPHPIAFTWHGGKVKCTHNKVFWVFRPPNIAQRGLLAIMKVDPLKPGPIIIDFMQRLIHSGTSGSGRRRTVEDLGEALNPANAIEDYLHDSIPTIGQSLPP